MAENVRPLLAKVWNMLEQAGLNSTQECIAYIAALLTESSDALWSFPKEHWPRKPFLTREIDEDALRQYLEQIKAQAGLSDIAKIFDRYILFYASTFAQKDAYPIPRHIVHFMLDLLDIQPEHHFADFTCGSGGFLVNVDQGTGKWPQKMVGVEVSPDWLHIAVANAALHQLAQPQINFFLDDAFYACGPQGVLRNEKFHRIAMAPSFGRNIDKKLVQATFEDNSITTAASEVLFTYLAQKKLEPGGRAVVMVPISLLTNRTGNSIRQKLIDEKLLEAVITLQPGMLQPFNNERVALLLIQQTKVADPPLEQCWFLNLEHDGYPRNPSRDLISLPPQPENDLPLAQKVLYPEHNEDEADKGGASQANLEVQHQTKAPITLIRVPENTTLVGLRHFAVQKDSQVEHHLLVQTDQNGQISLSVVPLQSQEKTFQPITDSVAWRRELYGIPDDEIPEDLLPTGDLLLEKATAGQKLAITREGRLLGFSRPFSALTLDSYNLIARDYPTTTRDTNAIAADTKVYESISISEAISESYQSLSDLHLELSQIEQQIIHLQGRLELPAKVGEPLPQIQPLREQILHNLGTEQQNRWRELQQLIEVSIMDKGIYPRPFHPQQLEASGMNRTEITQMLQLLENLGVVIQVSNNIAEEGREQPRIAYRRISKRDVFSSEKRPWE